MQNKKESITVDFDNSKRKKIIVYGLVIILFCAVFIGIILTANIIKIFYLAMFVLILVITLGVLIKSVKEMNSKNQVGLVLTHSGITFNGTSAAKKIGEIDWREIESLELKEAFRTKQLYLKLKNPQKYIQQQSKIELANKGVFINATELKVSFEELTSLTNDYLNKYGEASSPLL